MGVIGRLDQYASMLAWEFDDYSMSENLFLYSEQFNQSSWTNESSFETAETTGTLSPDRVNTAEKLIGNNGQANRQSIYQIISCTLGTTYTFSVFLKQAERRYATIWFDTANITEGAFYGSNNYIDLQTGIIANGTTQTRIVAYPNGWYRCYVTATPSFTGSLKLNLSIGTPNNAADGAGTIAYQYTGDGVSGIYIWGAQIERGSVPTDYTPTTTTAINRVLASTTNTNITGLGTYYSSGFDENIGFTTFLPANVFSPYDPVYDEFAGVSYGPGQGRYMRQNTDKSVIVYNEIDEISDFRDIVRNGLVLDLDAGMNASYNGSGTTWRDLTNSISPTVAVGQSAYTIAGTYTFTVPVEVTSISAVVIGGGGGGSGANSAQIRNETNNGGGGGGLAYGTIAVTPGETLNITVGAGGTGGVADAAAADAGGTSTIVRSATTLLSGGGGAGGQYRSNGLTDAGGASGGTARIGGGSGGNSGTGSNNSGATGGGGAGGYSGNGGNGGAFNASGSASTGAGGGGGGGFQGTSDTLRAGGGGGVGILGSGANGTAGTTNGGGGGGGSSGTSGGGNTTGLGGQYGGGGGGKSDSTAGTLTIGGAGTGGAVRIIWGTGRSYPSTTVTDQTTVVGGATTSNNALLINAPTYSSANGGYFVFNGTNQYVTSSFLTSSGQAVTYCGWLYSTETTSTYRNFVDSVTANPMIWWNTSGQIEFDAGLYTTPAVYRNQWVYVALSKPSGNSSPSYYVNGVLVGSGSAYTTSAVIPTWFNRAAAQTWKGNASNVQAYNRALSAAEISQNYNALRNRFGL